MAGAFVPPAGAVACWQVDLLQPDAVVAALHEVLAADERERAARFLFPRDRRRFIVARACLRTLVAETGDAAAVRFAYGEAGKPTLVHDGAAPPLHFNVSHSEELAVIALTRQGPLGVDVEAVRDLPELREIAARYFTAAETAAIVGAPPAQRTLAFFLCWTRKEAFSKVLGDGLSLALDRYRVACGPGEPARLLEIDGSAAAAAAWAMYDLRPAPGFVGALVMRAGPPPLPLRRLDVGHDVLARLRS